MSSWTWTVDELGTIGVMGAIAFVGLVVARIVFGDEQPPAL